MWINKVSGQIINENIQYTDERGNTYPASFPKSEIEELEFIEVPTLPTITTYQNLTGQPVKDVFDNWEWEWTITDWDQSLIDDYKAFTKLRSWEDIKNKRNIHKANGVKVDTKWYHSDDSSRIQQLALVMMGQNIPQNLQWKTMDGSFVTMTPTLAMQIFGATAASDQTIFTVAETHRFYMEASDDPGTYDFSGNWPVTYGEE